MKNLVKAIVISSFFIANMANAQSFAPNNIRQLNDNSISAGLFFRISTGASSSKPIAIDSGFGIYNKNTQNFYSSSFNANQHNRGLEYRFGHERGGVWSVGQVETRLDNSLYENRANASGGVKTAYVVGGVLVLALIGLALAPDKKPTMCSGNTIPNPISGKCEPLVL